MILGLSTFSSAGANFPLAGFTLWVRDKSMNSGITGTETVASGADLAAIVTNINTQLTKWDGVQKTNGRAVLMRAFRNPNAADDIILMSVNSSDFAFSGVDLIINSTPKTPASVLQFPVSDNFSFLDLPTRRTTMRDFAKAMLAAHY